MSAVTYRKRLGMVRFMRLDFLFYILKNIRFIRRSMDWNITSGTKLLRSRRINYRRISYR
jgi:hypothetical protein